MVGLVTFFYLSIILWYVPLAFLCWLLCDFFLLCEQRGLFQILFPQKLKLWGQMGCLLKEELYRKRRIIHARVQNLWRNLLAYSYRRFSARFNRSFFWHASTPCSLQIAFWEWEQTCWVKMEGNRWWKKCVTTNVFFSWRFWGLEKRKISSSYPTSVLG